MISAGIGIGLVRTAIIVDLARFVWDVDNHSGDRSWQTSLHSKVDLLILCVCKFQFGLCSILALVESGALEQDNLNCLRDQHANFLVLRTNVQ